MNVFANFEELTLGDILPIDGQRLLETTADVDVYLVRDCGVYSTARYHKTAKSVMEANREEAKNFSRTGRLGNNVKVATLPTEVFFDLHTKGIAQDPNDFKKWLNHSDNIGFRTNDLRL